MQQIPDDIAYRKNSPLQVMSKKEPSTLSFLRRKTQTHILTESRPHSISQDLTAASSKSNQDSADFASAKRYPSQRMKHLPINVIQQNSKDEIKEMIEFQEQVDFQDLLKTNQLNFRTNKRLRGKIDKIFADGITREEPLEEMLVR